MFNLIVVSMLFSGTGVSVDKLPHGFSALDAGFQSDKAQTISKRRKEFSAEMDKSVVALAEKMKITVSLRKILWSTFSVSDKMDGAIVLLNAGGEELGLFFYFRDDEWKCLTDDFK